MSHGMSHGMSHELGANECGSTLTNGHLSNWSLVLDKFSLIRPVIGGNKTKMRPIRMLLLNWVMVWVRVFFDVWVCMDSQLGLGWLCLRLEEKQRLGRLGLWWNKYMIRKFIYWKDVMDSIYEQDLQIEKNQ